MHQLIIQGMKSSRRDIGCRIVVVCMVLESLFFKECSFSPPPSPRPVQVVLSPGDVLFVPRHWWHYVECLEPAVSVNTWIDLVSHLRNIQCTLEMNPCLTFVSSDVIFCCLSSQPSDTHDRVKEAVVRTLVSMTSPHLFSFPGYPHSLIPGCPYSLIQGCPRLIPRLSTHSLILKLSPLHCMNVCL